MELKSLFLGLTFTIGVFALKSGVGLHYFFTQRHSLKGRILLSIGSALTYFFIFSISYLIIKKSETGQMEIITKKGKKIKALKVTKEKALGRGERLGIAYRLEDGTMIYVPE